MSTRRHLLIYGYCRRAQLECTSPIPSDIALMILHLYGFKYRAFAIGLNRHGEFALKHQHKVTKHWAQLIDFESHIHSLHDLYCGSGGGRFIIKNEYHRLYCCGKNDRAELGLSINKHSVHKFKQLKRFESTKYDIHHNYISLISKGNMSKHSFLKTVQNEYYAIGCNHYGQFGSGDKSYTPNPSPLPLYELQDIFEGIDVKDIHCGMLHSLFLTSTGSVYACGFNGLGQLGFKKSRKHDFENSYQFTPQKVPLLYDIIAICCGSDHNLCLSKQNHLFVFGNNDNCQLGLGAPPKMTNVSNNKRENNAEEDEENADAKPRLFAFEYSSDSEDGEEATNAEEAQPVFVDVPTIHPFFVDKKINKIKCGGFHSGVVLENGEAYTFGYNYWHQSIGDAMRVKYPQLLQAFGGYEHVKISDADLGMSHSLLLTEENELYSVGNNSYCQCTNQAKMETITMPYLVRREEIGIDDTHHIERVIAGDTATFVFTSTSGR